MKSYLRILAIGMLVACNDENETHRIAWEKLGLDGKSITEMQLAGSTLYVGTNAGLYKRSVGARSEDFTLIGFANKNVEAIEVIAPGSLIVSLFDKTGGETPALFKTNNDGNSWTEIASDFGGQLREPVFDLELHPENKNILYAAGYSVVAKSANQGAKWEPVYGNWGGLATGVSVVEINKLDKSEIWAGGQGAIENGFLLRTQNESDWDTWHDLVENPTVVKEITFSDKDKEELFVGFEGTLLKTSDGGDTWQTLIESEDNRFFFGIGLKENTRNRVYAAGWLKTSDAQPLILFLSNDGGQTWEEMSFPVETFGGVLDMQVRTENGNDYVYLGLDKGGVYRVSIRF